MFTDGRSRRVIFLAHCLLNQNAISDGTAEVPAAHREILQAALDAQAGVVQMPCPELCCLGLDRGDPKGRERPVVVENTRIRRAMGQPEAAARLRELTAQVVRQIREYRKHGFTVLGIVGVDRSPCCGVNTTSDGGILNFSEMSFIDGCSPCSAVYAPMNSLMALAEALSERLTFIEPSSRMNRFISPAIMGTA